MLDEARSSERAEVGFLHFAWLGGRFLANPGAGKSALARLVCLRDNRHVTVKIGVACDLLEGLFDSNHQALCVDRASRRALASTQNPGGVTANAISPPHPRQPTDRPRSQVTIFWSQVTPQPSQDIAYRSIVLVCDSLKAQRPQIRMPSRRLVALAGFAE